MFSIFKEHKYYVADAEKQAAKIEKMIKDEADPYDIKKQASGRASVPR